MTLADTQLALAQALTGGRIASVLDASALTVASELLIAKRRAEAAGWLPRTVRALGSSFRTRFAIHAAAFRPGGWNHPRSDALAFAEAVIGDRSLAMGVRALGRYEQAQARASAPGPFVIALRIARHPETDAAPPSGLHLWWRWRRLARLRYWHLPLG